MNSVYEKWKIGNKSIRIIGEKYSHSCPVIDFLIVIDAILNIYNKDTMFFKYKDLRSYLIKNNVCNDLNFKQNKYKITVTINTLLLENLIIKKTNKGPYRIANINELCKFRKKIEEQVTT